MRGRARNRGAQRREIGGFVLDDAWFALGTIPTSIILAIAMALLVNRAIPGRSLVRMAYFTPTILPMIAVANIWLFFYTPDIGLIDQAAGLFGFSGHNWLGDPATVLPAIIVMTIWKEAGFFMIFYLAALQNIPPELEEAARLRAVDRLRGGGGTGREARWGGVGGRGEAEGRTGE